MSDWLDNGAIAALESLMVDRVGVESIPVTSALLLQYQWEVGKCGGSAHATKFHNVPLEAVPADRAWLDAAGSFGNPTITRKQGSES